MNRIGLLFLPWWVCYAFSNNLSAAEPSSNPDSLRFETIEEQIPRLIRSDPDSVRQLIHEQQVLCVSEQLADSIQADFTARTYNNLGIYFRIRSDLDSALYYYQRSNEALDSARFPNRKAILINNIANVYFQRGDYPLALDQHFKALTIREASGDSAGILMSNGNIGLVYENLKEPLKARKHYKIALELAENQADTNMMAWAYTSLGTLELDQEMWKPAEFYLRKSNEFKRLLDDQRGISFNLTNLGAVYLHRFRQSAAAELEDSTFRCLLIAEKMQLEMKNDYGLAATWNYLGEMYIVLEQWPRALRILAKADSLTEEREHLKERVRTLELLSEAQAGRGNFKAALERHKDFKSLSDTLFNLERDKEIGRKEAWLLYQQELREEQLQHEADLALEASSKAQQRLILVITALSLVLALVLLGRLFQKWQDARQAREVAEAENELLAEKNEELQARIAEIQMRLEASREELPDHMEKLTKREMEVLLSLGLGLTDKEIAERLFISVATVRTHNRKIFEKLAMKNRTEAVAMLHRYNLV